MDGFHSESPVSPQLDDKISEDKVYALSFSSHRA